jgi:hypothetical protein
MKVLRKLERAEMMLYKGMSATKHIQKDRAQRLEAYTTAQWLDAFQVDKGHKDGAEVHIIDAVGYIHIYNAGTGRHITILSGRPAQIKRYYEQLGITYSNEIHKAIKIAHARNEATDANNI